uniref:Uncharacterized protein n=1 Tax=Anguilla anguilla TaxID=7936 RepID=A0A0E9WIG6_ANGAN
MKVYVIILNVSVFNGVLYMTDLLIVCMSVEDI